MAISLGSGLLTAALLLGQAQEAPTQVQYSTGRPSVFGGASQPAQTQSRFSWFGRDERPVMNKLQSWFGRKDQPDAPQGRKMSQPAVQAAPTIIEGLPTSNPSIVPVNPAQTDFPRKLPNPQSQTPGPRPTPVTVTPVSLTRVQQTALETPASAKSPILPQLANKIGRDEKFEWVTGQLEVEVGGYVLYYATPETIDAHHGRVSLQPQQLDMSAFRRGDLVSVRGELIQRPSTPGRSPVYRASDIQLIERVK